MTGESGRSKGSGVDAQKISICVRELNHAIGELARRYGDAAVVAALTQVMGCASCASDSVERGLSMRALVERTGGAR